MQTPAPTHEQPFNAGSTSFLGDGATGYLAPVADNTITSWSTLAWQPVAPLTNKPGGRDKISELLGSNFVHSMQRILTKGGKAID